MKIRLIISLVVICLGIGALTFTSLFFYDYNTRIVMVEEVQEETGEDIAALESDSDIVPFHNWNELISASHFSDFQGPLLLHNGNWKPSSGYFLDLIKPPII